MAKELNEDSSFKVSIKTLVAIGFAMATIISMWFMLQADIAEAKELPVIEIPPPDVTRMEFDMKDQNIRLTIQNTQDDVEEIKDDLKRIEEKIDRLKYGVIYEKIIICIIINIWNGMFTDTDNTL